MTFLEIYFPVLAAFVSSALILEGLGILLSKFMVRRQEKRFRALEKKVLEMQERGEEPTPEMVAELMSYLYPQMPLGGMPVPPAPKPGSGQSTGHYL